METQQPDGILLDIVYEILLRLPVKTLSRLQCVCKRWFSLIASPSFQQDHYHRSQLNPLLLITKVGLMENEKIRMFNLVTYSNNGILVNKFSKIGHVSDPYYMLTQSCQGLVCFAPLVINDVNPLLLCNPSTEELMALPVPPTEGYDDIIGLGYATSTKKIKVYRFFQTSGTLERTCEVFTLGTREWRKGRCSLPGNLYSFSSVLPFLNGALHCLKMRSPGEDSCVIAFDIETEEYTIIRLPFSVFGLGSNWVDLKEVGGMLCIIFPFKTSLEIWQLKDYNSGEWVKEYMIDLNQMGSHVEADPSAIMGDGSLLLSISVYESIGKGVQLDVYKSVYSYNSDDRTFTRRTEEYVTETTEEYGKGKITWLWGTLHVESFLRLGSNHLEDAISLRRFSEDEISWTR